MGLTSLIVLTVRITIKRPKTIGKHNEELVPTLRQVQPKPSQPR